MIVVDIVETYVEDEDSDVIETRSVNEPDKAERMFMGFYHAASLIRS